MNSLPRSSVAYRGDGQTPQFDHCPLCIPERLYPKNDEREPVTLFLDIDGVLIGLEKTPELRNVIETEHDKIKDYSKEKYHANTYRVQVAVVNHFNTTALGNFHNLIARIEEAGYRALVVISSSWRNHSWLKQLHEEVFGAHDFAQKICGKTPPDEFHLPYSPECKKGFVFEKLEEIEFEGEVCQRPAAILSWLVDHGLQESNYLAIDDWGALECFGDRFLKVDGEQILTAADVKRGLVALNIFREAVVVGKCDAGGDDDDAITNVD